MKYLMSWTDALTFHLAALNAPFTSSPQITSHHFTSFLEKFLHTFTSPTQWNKAECGMNGTEESSENKKERKWSGKERSKHGRSITIRAHLCRRVLSTRIINMVENIRNTLSPGIHFWNGWDVFWILYYFKAVRGNRDSSFGIAMVYGPHGYGPIPSNGKRFFSIPQRPHRPWGPPSLLFNGYQGFFPRG
jgi:hypothetical protein